MAAVLTAFIPTIALATTIGWSQSQFIVPSTPTGGNYAVISSASCASSTFCVAVGENSNANSTLYATEGNGNAWVPLQPPAIADTGYNGAEISCPSPGWCMAVLGSQAVTFAGGTWGTPATLDQGAPYLTAVACSSADYCLAGDDTGNVFTWDGTSWSSAEAVAPGGGIQSLSCTTQDWCAAISGMDVLQLPSPTAAWSTTSVDQNGNLLEAISCAQPDTCVATGDTNAYVESSSTSGWAATATG
ncbi:MAG: hypothetical protein M1435_01280, partial [Actinobacteria bacterium]|nr:hypothetical protein [Actinomycetota bacterium]